MDASAVHDPPARTRRSRTALRLVPDRRLVAYIRAGDQGAFEVIYDRHAAKLLSFCRHMLASQQDAEDALQRTFAGAYRALVADERAIELRPWLFAIARNECISVMRRRRPEVELSAELASTEGLAARVAQREDLRNVLADLRTLPERQRAALLLSELGGFSHAQIAEVIGTRPDQVKAHVFQARSNLIAERDARERSCAEVRQELANARGPALLRRGLRRHLRACGDCKDYSDAVAAQRRALALVLPVVPPLVLRSSTLSAALGASHGGGASVGIASLGSALANGGAKTLLAKTLAALAAAGAVVGAGSLALHRLQNRHATGRSLPTQQHAAHVGSAAASAGAAAAASLSGSARIPADVPARESRPLGAPTAPPLRTPASRTESLKATAQAAPGSAPTVASVPRADRGRANHCARGESSHARLYAGSPHTTGVHAHRGGALGAHHAAHAPGTRGNSRGAAQSTHSAGHGGHGGQDSAEQRTPPGTESPGPAGSAGGSGAGREEGVGQHPSPGVAGKGHG